MDRLRRVSPPYFNIQHQAFQNLSCPELVTLGRVRAKILVAKQVVPWALGVERWALDVGRMFAAATEGQTSETVAQGARLRLKS
jgi:hypothetical protein